MLFKPTKADIKTIQKMKSNGATDTAIAKVLGISRTTLRKYKNDQGNDQIAQAIKKGEEIRSESLLQTFEDNLPKQLTGYYVEEEESRVNPVTGKFELYSKKKKWMPPNATLMMFTSVNESNGKWQSINKVETNTTLNLPTGVELVKYGSDDAKEFGYNSK